MLGPLRVSVAPPSWMAARLHLYLCIVNRLSGGLCFGCSPAWPLTYICMREAARCHGTESSRCERKDGRMARTETELSELRCWGLFKKADLIRSCCGMTWPRRLHWQLQRHTQRGFGPYMPSSRKAAPPAERRSFLSNIQHSTWAETFKTAFVAAAGLPVWSHLSQKSTITLHQSATGREWCWARYGCTFLHDPLHHAAQKGAIVQSAVDF